ncbi:MAG TPA: FAD-dependent oxidoreductase [Candidatus Paceibacterota bacterium]
MNNLYDILILGGGPIGAGTAYALTRKGKRKIGMVTIEPEATPHATYQYAGGSVRWFWDDPEKINDTKVTADFIKKISKNGVDVSLHHDTYLFLNRGKHVPAINISSAKLISYFKSEARSKGMKIHEDEMVKKVHEENGLAVVTTSKHTHYAKKVLLAMGAQNARFMPDYHLEEEPRYLMILDLPVTQTEHTFPHTIVPIQEGVVFVFIKKLPEGWRFVVGQENVLPVPKASQLKAHYRELLEAGLGEVMPFLKKAKVERMLSGIDVENKTLKLEQRGPLYAANCGSAVRSCVALGMKIADVLSKK